MIFFTYFCIAQRRCNNFLLLGKVARFSHILMRNLYARIIPQIAIHKTLQKLASTFDQQVLDASLVQIVEYLREDFVVIHNRFDTAVQYFLSAAQAPLAVDGYT